MNNASPLIPKGSNLEQQSKARSSLKVKIFCALGANVAVLLVLLMQGCKREAAPVAEDPNLTTGVFTDTNEPAFGTDTNVADMATDTNVTAGTFGAQPELTTPQPTVPVASMTEYTVQKGDTFSTIAPKFRISVKELQAANPTVDPTKLQIGKKLNIPAATTTTATSSGATVVDTASGTTTYTVKSGDTLSKIATDFRTTVKAIQTANGLADTRIKVGQKLIIPAK
jgi:N-acetylmuramoyl-L-alanine amidase